PVDRAYSHYQMEHRWGRETLPFEQALEREAAELGPELERILADPGYDSPLDCSYVARGRYAEQIERWLEHFPRGQLLVLTSDERAVETVEKALVHYGAPVYVRKQIVHNIHVVRDLEARGAIFVDEETEVPAGATVVYSAHGVAPVVHENSARLRHTVIDAT